MVKQRRWLLGLSAAWGALLIAAGVYAVTHGAPTVKEQRTVAQAQPVVDRAVATVVTAAGPNTGARIGRYEPRAQCKVNVFRPGQNYQRVAELYVRPGGEPELLRAVAAALPRSYGSTVVADSLFADAGEFVRVAGTVAGPGRVRVAVYTGCRPADTTPAEPPAEPDRAPIIAVLDAVGAEHRQWRAWEAGCVRTTEAAAAASPGPLAGKFGTKELIIGADDLVVYRDGTATVVVSAADGELAVARTEPVCG